MDVDAGIQERATCLIARQAVMPNTVRADVKSSIVENYDGFTHFGASSNKGFGWSSFFFSSIVATT